MISRDLQCPYCNLQGWLKAHDTIGVKDPGKLFDSLGKSDRGFLIVKCPKCSRKSHFDPLKVLDSGGKITLEKQGTGCLLLFIAIGSTGAITTLLHLF